VQSKKIILFLIIILIGSTLTSCNSNISADESVLKNEGDLAFIQDGILQILEGSTGRLTKINENGQALRPKWSHDGQWLAFLIVSQQDRDSGTLWMVKRDGTEPRMITGLPEARMYGTYKWSPTENILAVSCQGIWLLDEQGQPKQVVKTGPDTTPDIAWSPDGQQIAYSLTLPYTQEEVENRSDALYTLDIRSGQTVQRLIAPAAGIRLAAWWPDGQGILYWENPGHGASAAADGLEMCSLPIGVKEPLHFTAGLTKRGWLSFAADNRLLRVAGAGRQEWTNKWLEICDLTTGTVARVNVSPGSVTADPSFSPDAKQIAFVTAPDLGSKEYPSMGKIEDWTNSITLWVANTDGSGARSLAKAGNSVQEPQWSKDGKYIMYMADNYLWIIDAQGNERHRIAGPFSTDDQTDYYYGSGSEVWDWYRG
jgi:TolB protein